MGDPPQGLRAALRGEARFLWDAMRTGFRWGFVVVGVLAFLYLAKVVLTDDAFAGSRALSMLLGLGYALYLGTIAGLVAGLANLVWRAVGAWIVVPIVVVPVTLWLSLVLFDELLAAQLRDLLDTAVTAAREHDWMIEDLGPAARVGPVILVIALPLLLADLGAVVLDPAVLWQLVVLVLDVGLVLALGTIPGAIMSALVLAIAYVRRLRRRHAAA